MILDLDIKVNVNRTKILWMAVFLVVGLIASAVKALVYNSMKIESHVGIISLKVQYKCDESNTTTQSIGFYIIVFNTGVTNVTLTNIKIRYWFTSEPQGDDIFICNYAEIGANTVVGSFGNLEGVDYLEISFTSDALVPTEHEGDGTPNRLPAGANTGEIQIIIYDSAYGWYNQTNDYSFDGTKTNYADWQKITGYYQGVLAWGTEPI
jgi:hypothetical protein